MKSTPSPASTKDVTILMANISFGLPGGPDISRTWPFASPPSRILSRASHRVDDFREFCTMAEADCVIWLAGTPSVAPVELRLARRASTSSRGTLSSGGMRNVQFTKDPWSV